jgi:adenosylcobyric acid synthase
MLGKGVGDPAGLEGPAGQDAGLGLLDVETRMAADKTLTRVAALHCATAAQIDGYEIHIGQTTGPDCQRPFSRIGTAQDGVPDGAVSRDGKIAGTYLHGLFSNDGFRAAWLAQFGLVAAPVSYSQTVEDTLDQLAEHMEQHLDVAALLDCAGLV